MSLLPDPPTKSRGRCAVCGHWRPPIAKAHGDPFCSRDCAGSWHSPLRQAAYAWALAHMARRARS